MGTLRGKNDALGVPAIECPATAEQGEHENQKAQQWPQRVIEKALHADHVNRRPRTFAGAGQLEHQAICGQIRAFIEHLIGLQRTDQHRTVGREQGEVVVNRPLHQTLYVVDLGQFQQRADHCPGIGTFDGLRRFAQIDPHVGQQSRGNVVLLGERVGHPVNLC
ncbi:hypothetical protein D3C80_831280 [compost metagenome]